MCARLGHRNDVIGWIASFVFGCLQAGRSLSGDTCLTKCTG